MIMGISGDDAAVLIHENYFDNMVNSIRTLCPSTKDDDGYVYGLG
jgi:hypothetical protein